MPQKSFIYTHRRKLVALAIFLHGFALLVCLTLLGAFDASPGSFVPTSSSLDAPSLDPAALDKAALDRASLNTPRAARTTVFSLEWGHAGTVLYPRLRVAVE